MKKRIISLLVSVAVLVGVLCIAIPMAATETNQFILKAIDPAAPGETKETAAPGETVTYTLSLKNSRNITAFGLNIELPDEFTLVENSLNTDDLFSDLFSTLDLVVPSEMIALSADERANESPLLSWYSPEGEDLTSRDEIVLATFECTVPSDAKVGSTYTVSLKNVLEAAGSTGYEEIKDIALTSHTLTVKAKIQTSTVSGTSYSWNNTNDSVYLLYDNTVDDSVLVSEWKDGTYSSSDNVIYTANNGSISSTTVDGKTMNAQNFTFETIPEGSYKLAIFKPGKYVPKIVAVTVTPTGVMEDLNSLKLWLYGDVNYDGNVLPNDATQINRYYNNKSSIFSSGDDIIQKDRLLAADITGDGKVLPNDATQINRYYNNKTSVFATFK